MPKENFNFIDVEPMLRSQPRMEDVPLGQIRISKFAFYVPKWMLGDRNRKSERYSLRIDQDSKTLLIRPDADGKNRFTRKLKSGLTMPAIFRSKRLVSELMGQDEKSRIFACGWNERHKGFVVDYKSPLEVD